MQRAADLKARIVRLPDVPGVYLFKDRRGQVIYIGKAKSLKKRVQSYFSRDLSTKTQAMLSKVADLEYRLTPSEAQAQILEASLVKNHQPHYNISLKDDKSFPWIKISKEDFPLVGISRRKGREAGDSSLYLGPYPNVRSLRQAVKTLRRIFKFRSCKIMPNKPCLYYRLKLCPAPCVGKISVEAYQDSVRQLRMFLESRYEELLKGLSAKMAQASAERDFERAAQLRDQINALATVVDAPFMGGSERALEDLRMLLKLKVIPRRIEAFDISNIQGREAAGSMVSFYNASADKKNYRRFRIRTVSTIDDYKMLAEVVRRRYSRLLKERLPLPDLVLIDGGKGHLQTAEREFKRLGLDIPMVSIAKSQERIYTNGRKRPIKLNRDTPALNIIRKVRDEAHRFALGYHHILRRKSIIGR